MDIGRCYCYYIDYCFCFVVLLQNRKTGRCKNERHYEKQNVKYERKKKK